MPTPDDASPLSQLALHTTPDASRLLDDLKLALNAANSERVFERMEHNHNARFCLWDDHDLSCRKPGRENLPPGKRLHDILPWPGAADHEVTLTDEVINEFNDLLVVSARRAQTSIMPAGLDPTNGDRMKLAEAWGGVREYFREQGMYETGNALAQWADCAWEYGHGIVFVGWNEETQLEKQTITAEELVQLLTAAAMQTELINLQEDAAGRGEDPEAVEIPEADQQALMEWVQTGFDELIADPALQPQLVAMLMQFDEDMEPVEAKRVARSLRKGEAATYYVPKVVCAAPDIHALKPGLNVFYPRHTRRIQNAPWIIMVDWYTAVQLREKAETGTKEQRWDLEVVEAIIEAGPTQGNQAFGDISGLPSWVMSASVVGQDIESQSMGEPENGMFRVLTAYYRSTALGGVPALYKTTISEAVLTDPLHHECCEHAHAKYPMVDYVREQRAPCLWDSRGCGELTFSAQDEMRVQINACSDNASLMIQPPLEVPMQQAGKKVLIAPRAQIPARRAGDVGKVAKIDVAGDFRGSADVIKAAQERSDRYWLRGPNVDPIAKATRQERLVGDWLASVREMEILTMKTIQEFAPDQIITGALGGQATDLSVSREDLRGGFSIMVEFDTGTLDPKTVETRIKMINTYVVAMDREGLLINEPLMRLMVMMINPSWGKLLVNKSEKAAQEDIKDITNIMTAALNGLELPYVRGKNHAARADIMAQLAQMPAMDEKGQPIPDPESGQAMPGRVARILMENPDTAGIWNKRFQWETFEAQQLNNARDGKNGGIAPSQPQAAAA